MICIIRHCFNDIGGTPFRGALLLFYKKKYIIGTTNLLKKITRDRMKKNTIQLKNYATNFLFLLLFFSHSSFFFSSFFCSLFCFYSPIISPISSTVYFFLFFFTSFSFYITYLFLPSFSSHGIRLQNVKLLWSKTFFKINELKNWKKLLPQMQLWKVGIN